LIPLWGTTYIMKTELNLQAKRERPKDVYDTRLTDYDWNAIDLMWQEMKMKEYKIMNVKTVEEFYKVNPFD
jgi:hypothetical protein